nr:MAG TPA: hypothetical protein [Caudoviricetes sp.]
MCTQIALLLRVYHLKKRLIHSYHFHVHRRHIKPCLL